MTQSICRPKNDAADEEGRVIHIGSLSKSVAPGLRIGFVIASPVVIRELRSIRLVRRHPPGNIQRALTMFIDRGYYHSYIRKVAMTSATRAEVFKQSFEKLFPGAVLNHCDGAASFWARFEEDVDSGFAMLEPFERGETTLEEYVGGLVAKSRGSHTRQTATGWSQKPGKPPT
ncbi:hypothetical protein [Candidatus Phyllobacterium onerii]|uniref:hypothetical protein n=1 Tax=Candidatus Phyllobacterium onerii TaxID=3020828 RepID=UPI00232C86F5|nr:hypothetical protein [Phyllobacterium sp. IY22]